MSLALDSCQWTLLGNNFTEECSGWSWDHLQWTLSEDCSHDLLANAILQEHQCFLSDSKKVSWISDALLMRFLAALHKPYLRLLPVNFTWNCLHVLFLKFWSEIVTFQTFFCKMPMHFWCIFDALLMHFWCTFDALFMRFSKVHQKRIKMY